MIFEKKLSLGVRSPWFQKPLKFEAEDLEFPQHFFNSKTSEQFSNQFFQLISRGFSDVIHWNNWNSNSKKKLGD